MKILYIASPPDMGGATIALYNLILGLLPSNQIVVIFPKQKGELMNLLDKLGVRYYNVNYTLNLWPNGKFVTFSSLFKVVRMVTKNELAKIKIASIINKEKPDLVHCNVGPIDVSLDYCKMKRIPHIWHIREYQDLDFNMKSFPSQAHFRRRIHKKGNYCISITNDIFSHWSLRSIDTVIYDGIFSLDNLKPIEIKKKKQLLFVGRIEPAKGALEAIKGFISIASKYKDYVLLLAGDPSNDVYFEICKKTSKESCCSDRILFLGHRNDVYDLMRESIAIIVSSKCEGFGFITAEAMLNGCYVIGNNTGGTKEQMDICEKESGLPLAYRYNNMNQLISGIEYAINGDTSSQCALARKIVIERYNNVKYASDIMNYYKKVLNHYYS